MFPQRRFDNEAEFADEAEFAAFVSFKQAQIESAEELCSALCRFLTLPWKNAIAESSRPPSGPTMETLQSAQAEVERIEAAMAKLQEGIGNAPPELKAVIESTILPPMQMGLDNATDWRSRVQAALEKSQAEPQTVTDSHPEVVEPQGVFFVRGKPDPE